MKRKIDAYRDPANGLILVCPDLEKVMFRLPSGVIHVGNVNLAELTLMYNRMGFTYVGDVYEEFSVSAFDELCLGVLKRYRTGLDPSL